MSKIFKGIAKGIKKIFKGIKKVFKKIFSSTIGKILLAAALIYVGGVALGQWGATGPLQNIYGAWNPGIVSAGEAAAAGGGQAALAAAGPGATLSPAAASAGTAGSSMSAAIGGQGALDTALAQTAAGGGPGVAVDATAASITGGAGGTSALTQTPFTQLDKALAETAAGGGQATVDSQLASNFGGAGSLNPTPSAWSGSPTPGVPAPTGGGATTLPAEAAGDLATLDGGRGLTVDLGTRGAGGVANRSLFSKIVNPGDWWGKYMQFSKNAPFASYALTGGVLGGISAAMSPDEMDMLEEQDKLDRKRYRDAFRGIENIDLGFRPAGQNYPGAPTLRRQIYGGPFQRNYGGGRT